MVNELVSHCPRCSSELTASVVLICAPNFINIGIII
jgi:hypothetical protein